MARASRSAKRASLITEADKQPAYKPLDVPKYILGRPTKYDPKYCQMLVDDAIEGYSFRAFSARIGVHVDTLNQWEKVWPEFSEACACARSSRLRSWEAKAIEVATTGGQGSQATMIIFGLKTMGADSWQEKQVLDVNTNITLVDLVKASMTQALPAPVILEGEIVDQKKGD